MRLIPTVVLTVSAMWFSYHHASPLPYGDEYELVDVLSSKRSIDMEYLFSRHNEHVLPIPRLLLHGLLPLFSYDFRFLAATVPATIALGIFVYLSCVCLSFRPLKWSDNALGVLMLTPGHAENFTWAWQLQYALNVALCLAIVGIVMLDLEGKMRPGRSMLVVSALLICLAGCGGNGVIATGCLWLALATVYWIDRRPRWMSVCFSATGFVFCCFLATRTLGNDVGGERAYEFWSGLIAFAASGCGPAASNGMWFWGWVAVLGFASFQIAAIARFWKNGSPYFLLTIGLGLTLLLYGIAVAISRTSHGALEAFQPRYFLLTTLWLSAVEVGGIRSGVAKGESSLSWGSRSWNRLPHAIAVVLGLGNLPAGWAYADAYQTRHQDVMFDIETGLPLRLLAEKHCGHPFGLYAPSGELLYQRMEAMRLSKLGPLAKAKPSPSVRKINADDPSVSLDARTGRMSLPPSVIVHGMVWRWSITNRVSDRRVAIGFFQSDRDDKPVHRGLYQVPEVNTRNAIELGISLASVQFQSLDPSAVVLLDQWSFLVVDEPQLNASRFK